MANPSATSIGTEENLLGVLKAQSRALIYMKKGKHQQRDEIQVQRDMSSLSKYLYRKCYDFFLFDFTPPLFPLQLSLSHITFPSISHFLIFTCRQGSPPSSLGLLTHLCLPSYLRYLILYLDLYPLWQALPRPFLYLTIASTMTKP